MSHSSTESEVISLNAPALDLLDLVIEVLHSCYKSSGIDEINVPASGNRSRNEIQNKHTNSNTKAKTHGNREVDELSKVDHVVTSAKLSHFEANLFIFEDNEAVIKLIIKGRSPTTRHVSRTHSVALDWSFDRINLDSQNFFKKHVDTKNQLADMLTNESFIRDERNHLLRLFNIMDISQIPSNHFSSTSSPFV